MKFSFKVIKGISKGNDIKMIALCKVMSYHGKCSGRMSKSKGRNRKKSFFGHRSKWGKGISISLCEYRVLGRRCNAKFFAKKNLYKRIY